MGYKTKAWSQKNKKARYVFEKETENIPQTRQTDLMTTINDNP